MNMIYNEAIEVHPNLFKKPFHKSLVKSSISSEKFIRFSENEIKAFIDHQEIIQCAHLLEKGLSNHKLAKLYFILFQVSMVCSKNETFINFLSQQNFHERLCSSKIDKLNLGERIILNKIANFMDTFKSKKDAKDQINSLVNEYHEYRILDSFKENSFVVGVCGIIKEYLFAIVGFLLTEVEFSEWNLMKDEVFEEFYVEYSELCTICKRINYIKCSLLALPPYKINNSISNLIEERHISIIEKVSTNRECIPVEIYKGLPVEEEIVKEEYDGEKGKQEGKEEDNVRLKEEKGKQDGNVVEKEENKKGEKEIKLAVISNLSVKKKLKAMNELINKQRQQV